MSSLIFKPRRAKIYTIFSPSGRLYQVEYAMKAIRDGKITSVGLKGEDCVVLVTQKIQIANVVPESALQLFSIIDNIGCCMTGRISDSRCAVGKACLEAARYLDRYDVDISADVLSNRMADLSQVATQHADMRPLACTMILIEYDSELGPLLYQSDPWGNSLGYRAVASGARGKEATAYLLKTYKPNLTQSLAIELAIECLGHALNVCLQSSDIDVGIVTKENPEFRILNSEEIDFYLCRIDTPMEVDYE